MQIDFKDLNDNQIRALETLSRPNKSRLTQSVLKLNNYELKELLNLGLLIRATKKPRERSEKFNLTDDPNLKSLIEEYFQTAVVTRRPSREDTIRGIPFNIEDLIERIGEKLKTILREKSTISSEQSVFSFYEFTKDFNYYLKRNMSYGRRIYFDKIYLELKLPQNSLNMFKTYLKDLTLIFPNKIRFNPMVPSRVLPRIIIEMGGTKYDSIVVTEPIP